MAIESNGGLVHANCTRSIIGAFFEVFNELGYGFLESVYAEALTEVLQQRGHAVAREIPIVIHFRGKVIAQHRMDMLVDDRVILEIKSTAILSKASHRQLLNYLRATNLEVGLVLHFGPEAKFYRVVSSNTDLKNRSAHVMKTAPPA